MDRVEENVCSDEAPVSAVFPSVILPRGTLRDGLCNKGSHPGPRDREAAQTLKHTQYWLPFC